MVGKPNIPYDYETRDGLCGESMPTPGLNVLDQKREASMADEGGMSGAVMESQDGDTRRSPTSHRPFADGARELRRIHETRLLAGILLGGIGVMFFGLGLRV